LAFIGFSEFEILRWKKAFQNSRCVLHESIMKNPKFDDFNTFF
jgi:hypothetical protein